MKEFCAILYADQDLLAIDKPAGILAIPDRWDLNIPVAQQLLQSQFGTLLPVHRIDKDTTGVLLYARNEVAHRIISSDFSSRKIEKIYFAIVHGQPESQAWEVGLPLRADGDRLHRTIIDASKGKEAKTRFEVIERFRGFALVLAIPETGRTHQIRVHLAASGLAIVADPLYGNEDPLLLSMIKPGWKGDAYKERPLIARTALHSAKVSFIHPKTKKELLIEAPFPRDFKATLAQLRKVRPSWV